MTGTVQRLSLTPEERAQVETLLTPSPTLAQLVEVIRRYGLLAVIWKVCYWRVTWRELAYRTGQ